MTSMASFPWRHVQKTNLGSVLWALCLGRVDKSQVAVTDDSVAFLCVLSVLPILEHPDCPRGLGSVDSREFVWSFREPVLYPLVISQLEAQAAHPEETWQCTVNHVSSLCPCVALALALHAVRGLSAPSFPWCWVLIVLGHPDSLVQIIKYFFDMCSIPSICWEIF